MASKFYSWINPKRTTGNLLLILSLFLFFMWYTRNLPNMVASKIESLGADEHEIFHSRSMQASSFDSCFQTRSLTPVFVSPSSVCPKKWARNRNTVWILETKHNWAKSRNLCAAEAIARQMPKWCVRLLTVNYSEGADINYQGYLVQQKYDNLRLGTLDVDGILSNTPLVNFSSPSYQKSKYYITNLSDALRLCILYKYGGIYTDSDIITFQPIDLSPNYVIRLRGGQIGNTVIKVSNSGKELIMKAMKRGNLQYRGDLYTTLMKALYTEVLDLCMSKKREINLNDRSDGLVEKCGDWSIYGHNSGALCRDKKPNDRNDTRTDKQMHELLHEENCSMFHWTQTYFGRSRMFVSQSLDPETLMAKMRAHSCTYVTTINDIF
ncbi:uncharacterized protein LOC142340719 [Convolutriloba macropyga]|uniref:uncharacterized protein LOC142340719 n=1 Tax=Convolutriloba macropyga TaxID=536237 RepID=UPI003F528A88